MKKYYYILSLLIITQYLSSCKSDDDVNPDAAGYFMFDGNKYDLSNGFTYNMDKNNTVGTDGYRIDIRLNSSGFKIEEENGKLKGLSGNGHGISFYIYSASPDQILSQVYNFNDGSRNIGDYEYSAFAVNADTDASTNTIFKCTQGSITVNREGSQYDLTFSGEYYHEDYGSYFVTGSFKGELKMYYDL